MRLRITTLLVFLTALLVVVPTPATAADGERITSYGVDVTVARDGSVTFTETIDYDFGGHARHGIIRAIPRWDDLPDGRRRQYDLSIGEVLADGAPAPVHESTEGAFRMLTIGDAENTVVGRHRYSITFSIKNALTVLTAADLTDAPGVSVGDVELYWDVIGNGWKVPISSASVVARVPAAPLLMRCYSGPSGSTATCPVPAASTTVRFGPRALAAQEPLTVVIVLPRSGFDAVAPADIVDQPQPWGAAFLSAARFAGPLALLVLALVIGAASRRRNGIRTEPVHEAVMFAQPDHVTPAGMAVAWKGRFDGRVLTATLLDLAVRGAVTLTPKSRKRLLVERHDAGIALSAWESAILDAALKGEPSAELGKYNAKLSKAVTAAQRSLLSDAHASGIRNKAAWRARLPWIVATVLASVLTVAALTLVSVPTVFAYAIGFALALTVGSAIGIALTPLVQTETSAMFLSQTLGFRRLLDTDAGTARRELANRLGLEPAAVFATMLPFAVVYGLDGAWAGAFPDLTEQQLAVYGLAYGHTSAISDSIATATRALASAMTNPASGGSGASGGSSGGGGGGGGGGSW